VHYALSDLRGVMDRKITRDECGFAFELR
jgi:hypothetical protein